MGRWRAGCGHPRPPADRTPSERPGDGRDGADGDRVDRHALESIAEAIAQEVAAFGIKVQTINPRADGVTVALFAIATLGGIMRIAEQV